MVQLITLFARSEPTTDAVCKKYLPPARLKTATDVQLYYDRSCTRPAARFRYGMQRPNRSSRTVVLNCWRYLLEWLPALKPAEPVRFRFTIHGDTMLAWLNGAEARRS